MSIILELKQEQDSYKRLKEKLFTLDYSEEQTKLLADNYDFKINGIQERINEYTSTWDEYVYILTKPSNPDLVKIGYTTNLPEVRLKQINNATGIIEEWELGWYTECAQARDLEKQVHTYLDEFRVRDNREGFNVSLSEAISAVQKINEERY